MRVRVKDGSNRGIIFEFSFSYNKDKHKSVPHIFMNLNSFPVFKHDSKLARKIFSAIHVTK